MQARVGQRAHRGHGPGGDPWTAATIKDGETRASEPQLGLAVHQRRPRQLLKKAIGSRLRAYKRSPLPLPGYISLAGLEQMEDRPWADQSEQAGLHTG